MADCTPLQQTLIDGTGTQYDVAVPPLDLAPIAINTSSGGLSTLQAATAGNLTRLFRLFLVADGATTITFYDGATALVPALKLAAGEQLVLDQSLFPWFQGSLDTDFKMNSSNAVQLTGAAWINLNPT
ncbi:MAG: hypothetical protein ACREHF_02175 [Rhizomicrobium sp.]